MKLYTRYAVTISMFMCATYFIILISQTPFLSDRQKHFRKRSQTNVPSQSGGEVAEPIRNFSFIKIHRVGSGTFHNMLIRFALNHNAFIALSNVDFYDVFPRQISPELLLPPPTHPNFMGYNMFMDHVIFNKTASDDILPKDVVYITQVRHPWYHAAAAYKHDARQTSYPWHSDPYGTQEWFIQRHGVNYSASRNLMALELGYWEKQRENNLSDFMPYLYWLNKQLFHVSILEHLDESLILLKRKMHWELKDLIYISIHINEHHKAMNESQMSQHKQFDSLDYALYEFFLRRHMEEVNQQDASFRQELTAFLKLQDAFSEFCRNAVSNVRALINKSDVRLLRFIMTTSHWFPSTTFQPAFEVKLADCVFLTIDEMNTKKALKYHMYKGACEHNPDLAKKLELTCDKEQHVLPGLNVTDIAEIFR